MEFKYTPEEITRVSITGGGLQQAPAQYGELAKTATNINCCG